MIFPQKFFPKSDPYVATLLSFSTYFVGFAARPLGAAAFGHFGDRVGRKALLVTTMSVMGLATMAIGFVPSYESVGLWGAVLLTFFRALQGIAVGGEWSGSVLMAGEWADPKRRGFTTSFPQLGAPLGMMIANGALGAMTSVQSEAAFLAWGWRVPFLASLVLIGIGLYIRLGVLESPVFANIKARGKVARAPVAVVLRENWREVALTTLLRTGQLVPYYIFTTYILTYGTTVVGMKRPILLTLVSLRSIPSILAIPVAGHVSDLYGRKRVIAAGLIGVAIFSFVFFHIMDTAVVWMVFAAMAIDAVLQDLQYGPQAALIAENFPASRRYSGSGLGYHLASITAAGPAPLVAAWLYETYRTPNAIAVYVLFSVIVSLCALAALNDRSGMLDSD